MNILTIVKIAWRNLWRSKLRSSVVILSVIFGIVGGIIIIAMSYGLNMERMNNAVDTYLSHIQIHNKKFSDDFNLRHTISNLSEIEEKINNDENKNLLTQYFLGNEITKSETKSGDKSRQYRYLRSFETYTQHKHNNFNLDIRAPEKHTLKEVFKLHNRSEEDIELLDKVHQSYTAYPPSPVTAKFNVVKTPRAIPDYYVKLNDYKGFCIVLNKYGTTRTFEELMFLAHPDFAISKTEDESVMVLNCSHKYWKDKKDYKEYIIPEEFLLYDNRL